MQTPQDFYSEYNIMPMLQLHQLRVAAIAKMICENFGKPLDTESVILACLFHDMGNIIKSDLAYFPDSTEPEGLAHWELVKKEFVKKYGHDHHGATAKIAKEIGLPRRVIDLLSDIGYSNIGRIVSGDDIEQKIAEYADTRVGPHGVLSLKGRLAEGKERYQDTRMKRPYYETDEGFEKLAEAAHELERQVFENATITPENITEAAIAPDLEKLREYVVFP